MHRWLRTAAFGVVAILALAMSLTTVNVAHAAPSKPDRALTCTMQQIGSKSGATSSPDAGFYAENWLQESFSGGVSCLQFQPASRVQVNSVFDNPEPLYHWRIALYTSSNGYLGDYTWDSGSQSNPSYAPTKPDWWYFYGPIITLSCATGSIHATMDIYESTPASGIVEGDFATAEGGVIHHNSANLSTC